LLEKRKDPFTKEAFKAGDPIVFCAVCKSAFLIDSWHSMMAKHCDQQQTLSTFPRNQSEIRFSRRPSAPSELNPDNIFTPNNIAQPASIPSRSQQRATTRQPAFVSPPLQQRNVQPTFTTPTSDSSGGCGCLLFLSAIVVLGLFAHYQSGQNKIRNDGSTSQNPPPVARFMPRPTCGDDNPAGIQNFYPVFVNKTDQNTLDYIKQNYCGDAFVRTRISSGRRVIQVVSFLDKDKAYDFAKTLLRDSTINSAEVGEPTQN
jgi:hypothetical protein